MSEHKPNSSVVTTNSMARELTIERIFNASRELVFQAWTDPQQLAQWWGPQGWTTTIPKMELRTGGIWHYCMHGPGGEEAWGKAIYQEITPPERIVYLDSFSDAEGNVVESMPQMVITVEFAEYAGKTKMISRAKFASVKHLESLVAMGMVEGLNQSLDRLEELLAKA